MKHLLTLCALLATAGAASAQTLTGVTVAPAQAKVGEDITLTATFDVGQGLNCHVRVEFGDGAQHNVVVNQAKDATTVIKHRYAKPGNYTVSVLPKTKLPALKCLGDDQRAQVTVVAAALAAAPPATAAVKPAASKPGAPACPAGWKLDARSIQSKTGAFTCTAKPGTPLPEGKLACAGALGYFENGQKGQIGCRP